ncbi:MAG: sigma-70 family RNA polymerase sigma factor [Opitutaceae bacterium]|jgi:RNA polymerase sigma-70 factor (ECF subfamily)|nr:sigma-70 family RNA polymerase sigma factor [Opitutaceae bacterium]
MNPETTRDEELMRRIRDGDERALQELLEIYTVQLCKLSYLILRKADLAQEAASNVFISVWHRRKTLTIKNTLKNYLLTAVGNQALKMITRQPRVNLVPLEEVHPKELADERKTEAALLFEEFQEEVEALLACMPPQRRLIFKMNRLENVRYKEIAEALCISERTVQNHMNAANLQMEKELPKFYRLLNKDASDR